MDENTFWYKFWTLVLILFINIIWATAGYWSLDRHYQGHYIVTNPSTVTSTK